MIGKFLKKMVKLNIDIPYDGNLKYPTNKITKAAIVKYCVEEKLEYEFLEDNEDGNITGSIIVVYNHVNVYKEGTYKVGYKVTDSMGMSASCVVKVTVKNYYGKEDINKNTDKQENTENVKNNESTEIKFIAPVNGEILREFAKDSLVYSDTLEEWITHTGVDIKADKTTVVKAAAKGKVEAIKNDPRYGLTVIISHNDGYKTVYANLLTAEYVVEGEDIEEGQTIGTVGNSSSFEIADDYHLHFELIKDGEYLNPCNFIDF